MVDLQHGENNLDSVQRMLQALSSTPATPIVRVPANVPMYIQRVLDLGAYGVIVPQVNTKAEAEAVVASVRYAPKGHRSWGPVRGAIYGGADYFANSADELLTLVMLESAEGAAQRARNPRGGRRRRLLRRSGGPQHLARATRRTTCRRSRRRPRRASCAIAAAARAAGKIAGVHAFSVDDATRAHRAGLSLPDRDGGDAHDPRGRDDGPGRAQGLTRFSGASSSVSVAADSFSTCAIVHWRGALSGRQRRNFVPCRKRPPVKWS